LHDDNRHESDLTAEGAAANVLMLVTEDRLLLAG
jgi:hypothetical protein